MERNNSMTENTALIKESSTLVKEDFSLAKAEEETRLAMTTVRDMTGFLEIIKVSFLVSIIPLLVVMFYFKNSAVFLLFILFSIATFYVKRKLDKAELVIKKHKPLLEKHGVSVEVDEKH